MHATFRYELRIITAAAGINISGNWYVNIIREPNEFYPCRFCKRERQCAKSTRCICMQPLSSEKAVGDTWTKLCDLVFYHNHSRLASKIGLFEPMTAALSFDLNITLLSALHLSMMCDRDSRSHLRFTSGRIFETEFVTANVYLCNEVC